MALETPSRSRQSSLQKANVWSLIFYALLIPVYALPYWTIWVGKWEWQQVLQMLKNSGDDNSLMGMLILLLIVFGGIFVHELLHGATWAYYAKGGWQSVQFGVAWKALAPYCHCEEPMPRNQHLQAILMPGFVLGLLPALIGLALAMPNWLLFGWFFTGAAAGDVIMARMMLKEPPTAKLRDMDHELGFYIYEPEDKATDS